MSVVASVRALQQSAWNGLLDIVFPPQCVSCRVWGSFLCDNCEAQLQPADGARCQTCWQLGWSPCSACTDLPRSFEAARSVYDFAGPARNLVHALKYHGVTAVAPLMSSPMLAVLSDWDIGFDAIVAVPMTRTRERRRGYNHAEKLAHDIGKETRRPVIRGVIRKVGASQVEQPDKQTRRANAETTFEMSGQIAFQSVLLIDDVMTTGSTLDVCARALKQAGADRVYGLTFARES